MTLNLVVRKPYVTVDGLDVSSAIIALTWGDSDYESQSGVIKCEGSLTLSGLALTEDLDDRTNPRWARGKVVRIQIANESNTLTTPRCGGWQYILKSQFDGHQELTIQIGCLLALMDSATPPGEGIEGFAIGQSQGAASLFASLGAKIGAAIVGNLGGYSLNVPLSKLNQDSPVKQLGALCWANGRLAHVDGRTGEISVLPINVAPAPILDRWVVRDAVEYTRTTGAESPCEKVLVTGTKIKAKEPEDDFTESLSETYGSSNIVRAGGNRNILLNRTYESEELNRDERTRTRYTKIEQPSGLFLEDEPIPDSFYPDSEGRDDLWARIQTARAFRFLISSEVTEISTFEKRLGGNSKIDEGRLMTVETIGKRQADEVYGEYNDNRTGSPGDEDYNGSKVLKSGLIGADRTIVSYTYRPTRTFTDSAGNSVTVKDSRPVLTITTETQQRRAEVFPQGYAGNPTSWQFVLREVREWIRDDQNPDGWKLVTTTETPQLLDSKVDIATIGLIDHAAQGAKKTTKTERGPGIQPPSPERFPVDASTEETQIVGEAKLPGLDVPAVRDREREYRAEAGMITSKAQADKVAKIEGAILWGRYKGAAWVTNVPDPLLTATPLQAWDWTEPTGKVQRYLIDGLSFAYSERRTVSAADGIWVGQVGVRSYSPPIAPIDPPAVDPEDETESPPTVHRPYSVVDTFDPALGMSAEFRLFPYPLTLAPDTFNPAMAIALPGLFKPGDVVATATVEGGEWLVVEGDGGDAVTTATVEAGERDPDGDASLTATAEAHVPAPSGKPTTTATAEGAEE